MTATTSKACTALLLWKRYQFSRREQEGNTLVSAMPCATYLYPVCLVDCVYHGAEPAVLLNSIRIRLKEHHQTSACNHSPRVRSRCAFKLRCIWNQHVTFPRLPAEVSSNISLGCLISITCKTKPKQNFSLLSLMKLYVVSVSL